jgi:hypothetical protein
MVCCMQDRPHVEQRRTVHPVQDALLQDWTEGGSCMVCHMHMDTMANSSEAKAAALIMNCCFLHPSIAKRNPVIVAGYASRATAAATPVSTTSAVLCWPLCQSLGLLASHCQRTVLTSQDDHNASFWQQ